MANPVARWPHDPTSSGGVPPGDIYKVAVEEYRFQVRFNWTRTQYLLVFNTGMFAVASAIASWSGRSAILVYAVGAAAAVLTIFAVRTQHDYYRAARDRMRRIETVFGIPEDQRTDNTSALGRRRRTVSVNQSVYLLLVALTFGDLVGVALVLVPPN